MLVYHGTNADIAEIDLTKGTRFKDFGQGFYVTPDLETAQRMARKKVALFKGKPTVIRYELDESALTAADLDVLTFPEKASAQPQHRRQHAVYGYSRQPVKSHIRKRSRRRKQRLG